MCQDQDDCRRQNRIQISHLSIWIAVFLSIITEPTLKNENLQVVCVSQPPNVLERKQERENIKCLREKTRKREH